jgi:S-adenosylmethionine decarboxylase
VHLTIDGYGGDRELLSNEPLLSSLLDVFPGEIQMTKIAAPYVLQYVGDKPEDWGISGFVLIAESHIAIHTFPERGYVWCDIFSCKAFEAEGAVDRIVSTFGLKDATVVKLERGLEYPHDIPSATPIAMGERVAVTSGLRE